jgi:hypothetical protein
LSLTGIEMTLKGYEDELLRDEDDDMSLMGFGGTMHDTGRPCSLVCNHNSVLLKCLVCADGSTGSGVAADTVSLIYVLPLLLNIVDVENPCFTSKQYEVVIAFPSQ